MAKIIFPTSVTIPLILKQTTINNGLNNAQFSSTLAILLLSLGCLLSINPALAKPADGDDEGEEGDDDARERREVMMVRKMKMIMTTVRQIVAASFCFYPVLQILPQQNTALLSSVCPCVRHRRDISVFHLYNIHVLDHTNHIFSESS